ncbi:ACT domain-containing protein [Microbulbifer sp. CAU 1566]|uniref:ACT domain-containing protein n=1 Tax=unclassified Microbulbifer TaxID=2619833 RepID=UPI00135A1A49|nr:MULTISPECIES: ACT domain-containing protein [unclassified Microbulbifer]MCK7598136.1 ACT domain-containing protein [Microbulbifer sp. CAU 1566]
MNAQVKIDQLLQRLTPILNREPLVMCLLDEQQLQRLLPQCLCIFREREGICALLSKQVAECESLLQEGGYRQITLHFSSCLQVPGLTGTIVRELAEAGIQANVVSARCHEHLLVSEHDAPQAMQILYGISNRLQYS